MVVRKVYFRVTCDRDDGIINYEAGTFVFCEKNVPKLRNPCMLCRKLEEKKQMLL